jgi:hypothetical protein
MIGLKLSFVLHIRKVAVQTLPLFYPMESEAVSSVV